MTFKSKTEAYTYAISLMYHLADSHSESLGEKEIIHGCINKIKISMENHEQDPGIVMGYLKKVAAQLSETDQQKIDELLKSMETSDYQQTAEEKFENPLARRSESELAIALLQKPTKAMMQSVQRVSDEILKLIDDLGDSFDNPYALNVFTENSHVIALGAFKNKPTASQIKALLKKNDPDQLAEIMFIHFKFAQAITREYPIKRAPEREPVGQLKEIVKQIWDGDPKEFFSKGIASSEWEGRKLRSHISDVAMYESRLYTAIRGRGRTGVFDTTRTQQMGLMLRQQASYAKGLPQHSSSWVADCKSQPADLNSQYVIDLIDNDAVYIAGPSGMTSMFLGQMEILANFENENLKKNYLTAVASYIVGGGFHSLHEVIGPAQYALNLVPGYHVQVPQQSKLAPPPNYYQFFRQQEDIDPEFASRREAAWHNYLDFFDHQYVPNHFKQSELEQLNSLKKEMPEKIQEDNTDIEPLLISEQYNKIEQLRTQIIDEINGYIKSGFLSRGRSDNQNDLSFISKVFRNEQLTKEKLKLAIDFRDNISRAETVSELKSMVDDIRNDNRQAEKNAGKIYGLFTKSGLERTINTIQSLVTDFEKHQEQAKKYHTF